MKKWIYNFGGKNTEGDSSMHNLLGGKGANLAEMCKIGLPVPPGFTITTELCNNFYDAKKILPQEFKDQLKEAISLIESKLNLKFGDNENQPLLVSVRSGARVSMPGMMDTVLNLGLNDETVKSLAHSTNNEKFAYDSYRRFIQMYGDVVMGIKHYHFEEILDLVKQDNDITLDSNLEIDHLKEIISMFKSKISEKTGKIFPTNVYDQLNGAIEAVLDSWMNQRAITYRRMNDICDSFGTAVNIQSMVFGNMGDDSATGVAFTRNPSNGDNFYYGEYLINAQGEDVVAGIRTPMPINRRMLKAQNDSGQNVKIMEEVMPNVYAELVKLFQILENHYKDMQDIEFTIEKGKLWVLQTRSGKRTAKAAMKIAVDLAEEGKISRQEALLKVDPYSLDQLLHPMIDPNSKISTLELALPASPGAASGMVVFSSQEAEEMAKKGHNVILVRIETSPEDIGGMNASQGIITSRGGMTSHAAVVARGMGKPCVVGASGLKISYNEKTIEINGKIIKEKDIITINGSTGEIIDGEVKMVEPSLSGDFEKIMNWSGEFKKLTIRTNAETKKDAETAIKFGAEGIGLCRTEHMFFEEDRISAVREMIMASDSESRKNALNKILPMQKKDFTDLLKIMDGLPINIRLLDPPLHEFLPTKKTDIEKLSKTMNIPICEVENRIHDLEEFNPMLGNRGCRLGICYPEIYECQVRAIFESMAENSSTNPNVEIMVPLIISAKELELMKTRIENVAKEVETEKNIKLSYQIGTMIELPRSALMSKEIAKHADFFSYGTNDLTQTTMGISRDDSASFMNNYVDLQILPADPFVKFDQHGVGELVKISAERGRELKPEIKLGICGEHGGDPHAVDFFHAQNFNYVSCSPYRVPIAKLAAAISNIKLERSDND